MKNHSEQMNLPIELDYSKSDAVPAKVKKIIEAGLAIDGQSALTANKIGFMARALVQASLPYKNPDSKFYVRKNGNLTLEILSAGAGVPYGKYPRLLLSWITTEAVKTKSREIVLGESLGEFLHSLNLKRGGANKEFLNQMQKLFSSFVNVNVRRKTANGETAGFGIKNIHIVDAVDVTDADATTYWQPQDVNTAGTWKSKIILTEKFHEEITQLPVPIDLRAHVALSGSPLEMDLYTWCTWQMSILKSAKLYSWGVLQSLFGPNYALDEQGARNFKKKFVAAIKSVQLVYRAMEFEIEENGIVLLPSPTHIPKRLF